MTPPISQGLQGSPDTPDTPDTPITSGAQAVQSREEALGSRAPEAKAAPAARSLPVAVAVATPPSTAAPTPVPAPVPDSSSGGALLAPAPGGWRVIRHGASAAVRKLEAQAIYGTLLEAWEAALPAGAASSSAAPPSPLSAFSAFSVLKAAARERSAAPGIEVALPARYAVVEGMQLPSTAREELDGMVSLQLEKTLPYPIEEVLSSYRVIKSIEPAANGGGEEPALAPAPELAPEQKPGESESSTADSPKPTQEVLSVLSVVAFHQPGIEAFLAPLLEQGATPSALTMWGDHLATQIEGTAYAIWGEGEESIFAAFEGGALLFVEALGSLEAVLDALPRLRIGAEVAGLTQAATICYVDPVLIELSTHRALLSERLGIPGDAVAPLPAFSSGQGKASPLDFTPPAWRQRRAEQSQRKRLLRRVAAGALVYVVLLLLAFGVIALRKQQSRRLEAQLAAIRPQLDSLLTQQSRWKALGPAVDTRQFTLELMREIFESLPSPEVRVTLLEQGLGQFRVEVEAPTAAEAIDFGERLKAREALSEYQFEAGQPTLSGSDKAQYRLFGKL